MIITIFYFSGGIAVQLQSSCRCELMTSQKKTKSVLVAYTRT